MMMKIFSLIGALAFAALFTSCEELAFPHPMPHETENLTSIPEIFHGTFVSGENDQDTVVVTAKHVSGSRLILNEDNVIRKSGKYYIVSQRNRDRWNVAAIRCRGKRGFDYYVFDLGDNKGKEAINKIVPIETRIETDNNKEYSFVNPTDAQFRKMLRCKAFVRKDRFRRISG